MIERSKKKTSNDKESQEGLHSLGWQWYGLIEDLENEVVKLSLMPKDYESNEKVTSSDNNLCISFDELQDAFTDAFTDTQGPKKVWVPKSQTWSYRFPWRRVGT